MVSKKPEFRDELDQAKPITATQTKDTYAEYVKDVPQIKKRKQKNSHRL